MPCLKRNPAVLWREEPPGREPGPEGSSDVPCLTLVYLGTMFQVNRVAAEIWKLCDGSRDAGGITEELLGRFDVERGSLASDVEAFLGEMLARGWLLEEEGGTRA